MPYTLKTMKVDFDFDDVVLKRNVLGGLICHGGQSLKDEGVISILCYIFYLLSWNF